MGSTGKCETVVGVFDTRDRAERAVAELRAAGYRDDQIGMGARVAPGDSVSGSKAAQPLCSAEATGSVAGALVDLNVSEQDSKYYEGEVAAGRFVVTVNCAGDSADAARTAIGRNCGYGRIAPNLR
jgi:hypothetical protein